MKISIARFSLVMVVLLSVGFTNNDSVECKSYGCFTLALVLEMNGTSTSVLHLCGFGLLRVQFRKTMSQNANSVTPV